MIYANTVSGAFQTASHLNLVGVWNDARSPAHTRWIESGVFEQSEPTLSYDAVPTTTELRLSTADVFGRLVDTSWTSMYLPVIEIQLVPLTAQRIEDAKVARETINELSTLEDNWDGYGASRISGQACQHALHFVDIIEAAPAGVPLPDVSPTSSGTIAFDWEMQNSQAYLEIGNTRYSGYLRSDMRPPTFVQGQADLLSQQVATSVRKAITAPVVASRPVTEIHVQTWRQEIVAP
jgi:hypothetical protein